MAKKPNNISPLVFLHLNETPANLKSIIHTSSMFERIISFHCISFCSHLSVQQTDTDVSYYYR